MPFLLSSPSISARYATLAELGGVLARQGVSVRIAADCASDVYAIRATKGDWANFRAALVADGRLTISEDGGTWTIALDAANRAKEKAALSAYAENVRAGLQEVFGPATARTRALWDLSDEKRDEGLDADRTALGPDPKAWNHKDAVRYAMVREALSERQYGEYSRLSVPAILTLPGTPLGTIQTADMLQATSMMVPSGDVRKHPLAVGMIGNVPEAEIMPRLRAARVGGKIVWDPLTLTTGLRWPFWTPEFAKVLDLTDSGEGVEMLTPKRFALDPPKVAWKPAVSATKPAWGKEATMPARTIAASEAMLRWAEANDADLVAYVSPLGDLPLPAKARRSLAEIQREVDAGGMDAERLRTVVFERTGLYDGGYFSGAARGETLKFRLPPQRRLSLLSLEGFAVVRTETRYLDGLASKSLNPPTAWSNLWLKDTSPPVDAIVRQTAKLKPREWTGGIVPLASLEWCNPISFHPIAALLAVDPKLRAEIQGLAEGGKLSRTFAEMPKASILRNALSLAAPYNDAFVYQMFDPIFLDEGVRDPTIPFALDVERRKGYLAFRVVVAKAHEDGQRKAIWASWVRLP